MHAHSWQEYRGDPNYDGYHDPTAGRRNQQKANGRDDLRDDPVRGNHARAHPMRSQADIDQVAEKRARRRAQRCGDRECWEHNGGECWENNGGEDWKHDRDEQRDTGDGYGDWHRCGAGIQDRLDEQPVDRAKHRRVHDRRHDEPPVDRAQYYYVDADQQEADSTDWTHQDPLARHDPWQKPGHYRWVPVGKCPYTDHRISNPDEDSRGSFVGQDWNRVDRADSRADCAPRDRTPFPRRYCIHREESKGGPWEWQWTGVYEWGEEVWEWRWVYETPSGGQWQVNDEDRDDRNRCIDAGTGEAASSGGTLPDDHQFQTFAELLGRAVQAVLGSRDVSAMPALQESPKNVARRMTIAQERHAAFERINGGYDGPRQ